MQPFYRLKFEEYDLAYQLDREDLDEKIKLNKKGDALALAMRHKLKRTVTKMQMNDKNNMGGLRTLSPQAANSVK